MSSAWCGTSGSLTLSMSIHVEPASLERNTCELPKFATVMKTSAASDGFVSMRVIITPGSSGPERFELQCVPPSSVRNSPPFSVATYTAFVFAGATSIAEIGLPSRTGVSAAHDWPSFFVRYTRWLPVYTVFVSFGSNVVYTIQTPPMSSGLNGGETLAYVLLRNRYMPPYWYDA